MSPVFYYNSKTHTHSLAKHKISENINMCFIAIDASLLFHSPITCKHHTTLFSKWLGCEVILMLDLLQEASGELPWPEVGMVARGAHTHIWSLLKVEKWHKNNVCSY